MQVNKIVPYIGRSMVTIQLYKWSILALIDKFDNFELVNIG